MNKKEKRLAMATALQSAAGSITVVDDVQARARPSAAADLRPGRVAVLASGAVRALVAGALCPAAVPCGGGPLQLSETQPRLTAQASLPEAKTKLLAGALQRWGVPSDGHALLILNELSEPVKLASRNMPKLKVNSVMGLNAYDILRADRIVVEREALKHIQVRAAGSLYGFAFRL